MAELEQCPLCKGYCTETHNELGENYFETQPHPAIKAVYDWLLENGEIGGCIDDHEDVIEYLNQLAINHEKMWKAIKKAVEDA